MPRVVVLYSDLARGQGVTVGYNAESKFGITMELGSNQEKRKVDDDSMNASRSLLNGKMGHCPWYILSIVLACLMFVVVLFMNYFNGMADGVVFRNTIGNTSDYYYFEITPAGWAFSIWGVIYFMQAAFLIYAIASIFRSTSVGPLYRVKSFLPLPIFLIYALNQAINISWLFSFDRRIIILSLFMLLAIPITLIASMIWCFFYTTQNIQFFKSENQRYEMVLLNLLVYNAWAIYLGWTVCASLLNFGFVLIYSAGVDQEITGIVTLTFLLILIVVMCPLELTIFDKHLRYVLMHYIGPIMALSGSINKAGLPNNRGHVPSGVNRNFAIGILVVLLLFVVAKLINLGIRCWKQPLYYDNCLGEREEKNGPPRSA